MEGPGIPQYVGLSTKITTEEARCLYKPGSRYVGLSVKITTKEAESLYTPRGQESKVGNVQMSARVCMVREATVPQGASCVCESARVGGGA